MGKDQPVGACSQGSGGLCLSVCVGCLVCFGFVSGGGLQVLEEVTSLGESWELSQVSLCHVVTQQKMEESGFPGDKAEMRSVYKIMDVSILKLCW